MNQIDLKFALLLNEIRGLSEQELYHQIRLSFENIPDVTKKSMIKFFNQFLYWGSIDIENNNYEEIELKVQELKEHVSDFEELYKKGYIDKKRPLTYDFNGVCVDTNIRYSEYLPIKDVMQHLYRLNEYYEVNLYKGTYYKETEKLDIGPLRKNEVPIRVFPLQDNNNGNKNWLSMGMLATKNNPNDIKVNIRDVFETIPDNVTEEDF